LALPRHAFGLDVVARVGVLRYTRHRSVPETHQALTARGVALARRTATDLPGRYDELPALAATRPRRPAECLRARGRVVLAVDGSQPDVGHEVPWVLRDCLGGRVLSAHSLLSAGRDDLAGLIGRAAQAAGVPVAAVVSDGRHAIRKAVARALPGVPHRLRRFHYPREAARPIHGADRHARKEPKKRGRGVRLPERQVEHSDEPTAEVVRGYCAAVRGALTDDGRPPLAASGLRPEERLGAIGDGPEGVAEKGGCPPGRPSRGGCRAAARRRRRPCGRRYGWPAATCGGWRGCRKTRRGVRAGRPAAACGGRWPGRAGRRDRPRGCPVRRGTS
jgi:hypothetical protein